MTNPLAALSAAAPATPGKPDIAKVAKQFEAVFMRQMIAAMRSATLADDTLGSSAQDQFRDLADARLADSMAGANGGGGFGIAELLTRQLGGGSAAEPKP